MKTPWKKEAQNQNQQHVAPDAVGGDPVQTLAPIRLCRGLDHRHLFEDIGAQGVAFRGDDRFRGAAVAVSQDLLVLPDRLQALGVTPARLLHQIRVVLQEFDQEKAARQVEYTRALAVQAVAERGDLLLYVAAEKNLGRTHPGMPGLHCPLQELGKAPAGCGHGGGHRHPQEFRELPGVDGDALAVGFVHHVQGHHQGSFQTHQLQGELQAAV